MHDLPQEIVEHTLINLELFKKENERTPKVQNI